MRLVSRAPSKALLLAVAAALIGATALTGTALAGDRSRLTITKSFYGTTTPSPTSNPAIPAREVDQYTLSNSNRMQVKIITFGGIITSLRVGHGDDAANVVLGFKSLQDYETKNGGPLTPAPHTGTYFGALIGRYGNRIAKGMFMLNGQLYCLDVNNGANSLHGGITGFNAVVWDVARVKRSDDSVALTLHYLSKAGEGFDPTQNNNSACIQAGGHPGYPGNLNVWVTYSLNRDDQLRIDYRATTDAPTVVNLTNHTYWNLNGEGTSAIYDHRLQLNANAFTPDDPTLIPTGAITPVAGTVFDFRRAKPINDGVRSDDPQVVIGKGFDHNWVLNTKSHGLSLAASLSSPGTDRSLEIWTDQPGIQFYSGNFLDGSLYGTSDHAYRQGDGLALETQHFPDSPNHANFPSTVLNPGQTYRSTTIFALDN